jgi:tyrosyl-tRNA synthetase
MMDSEEDVVRKIKKAYCPEKQTFENPVLEYARYIIFEKKKEFKIERTARFGGDITLKNYAELERIFSKGELHPLDLKTAVTREVNEVLDPVRRHFAKNPKAKRLYEQVQTFEVTR